LFLSGLSNRPANALGGEGDDLLAQLRDGVPLGAHWFAPLLKKQSQLCAEIQDRKTKVSDNLGQKSCAEARIFVRDKNCC
jgi:hypothetical protein